MQRKQA